MIENDIYKMYFTKIDYAKTKGVTLKYVSKLFERGWNDFQMIDIINDGITNHYGKGDDFMDLTENKGLKIIGVDII